MAPEMINSTASARLSAKVDLYRFVKAVCVCVCVCVCVVYACAASLICWVWGARAFGFVDIPKLATIFPRHKREKGEVRRDGIDWRLLLTLPLCAIASQLGHPNVGNGITGAALEWPPRPTDPQDGGLG
jgi:hypothetical protein